MADCGQAAIASRAFSAPGRGCGTALSAQDEIVPVDEFGLFHEAEDGFDVG